MVVTVFRSRLRPGFEEEIAARGARMLELASAMPGFISYKDFAAEDGENVAIVEFETMEQVVAWRDNPEHREVQALGRTHYFEEFTVQVCELVRSSHHPHSPGA